MRKRDRLKRGIRRLMGTPVAEEAEVSPAQAAPPPQKQPAPAPAPVPAPTPVAEPVKATEPEPVANSEAEPVDPKEAEMAAKAAKHFEKTRVAMLRFIVEHGGQSTMADMHAKSESRYFIAHKRFSDLMEGIVSEGLIDFDHSTGIATITSAGEAYIAE